MAFVPIIQLQGRLLTQFCGFSSTVLSMWTTSRRFARCRHQLTVTPWCRMQRWRNDGAGLNSTRWWCTL